MAARADVLGDIGDERAREAGRTRSATARPRDGDGQREGPGRARERARRGCAGRDRGRGGATVVGGRTAPALEGGREHFGYADGFAQPSIEGSGFAPLPGAGAPPARTAGARSSPASSCSATPTSRTRSRPRRRPTSFGVNGSYLVYRKLAPGRRGFRRRCATPPPHYPGGEELLAAKLVGRWRDGTPLDVSPRPPGPGAGRRPAAQQRVRLRATTRTACAARSARTCGG